MPFVDHPKAVEPMHHGSPFATMAKISLITTVATLAACAAPPRLWPDYDVTGNIGLLISLPQTIPVVDPSLDDTATQLESAAAKQQEKSAQAARAAGVGALFAPLAVLGLVYPEAFKFAAMPFVYGDDASKAGNEAERLQAEAANLRQDSACNEQLSAVDRATADKFQRDLSEGSLGQLMQTEVRSALHDRTGLPVTMLAGVQDTSPAIFIAEASKRRLPNLLEIEVLSFSLGGEFERASGVCGYKVTAKTRLQFWMVEGGLVVYGARSTLGKDSVDLILYPAKPLPNQPKRSIDAIDIPNLVERPEEFRLQLAKWFGDAVSRALDSPTLKFPTGPIR